MTPWQHDSGLHNNGEVWTSHQITSDVLRTRGTLDEFVTEPGCVEGVAVQSLDPGDVVEVTTRNSCYRMVFQPEPGYALVTGGSRFHEPTLMQIEGSTAGGSALKGGWIGVGLRLEMWEGARRILTSRVQSVRIV